ncbi:MAG: sulfotransferase [Myxococcota bacterium]|nr:sulfotransferase [Myxococcota bacterium]
MISRILSAWGIVGRTFGAWLSPAVSIVLFGVLRLVIAAGRVVDRVLTPRTGSIPIEAPIVLVGNPRSGTTFLHRYLVKHGVGVGTQLDQMLFASTIIQKLVRPFLPLMEKVSPARHHLGVAHETNLQSIETDDAALLFRYLDGFLWYGFILAWDEEDHSESMRPEVRDTAARDFEWWRSIWRRTLAEHGSGPIIAKPFTLTMRIPRFLEDFPDARVIYMVRDPLDVIPSTLSLVTGPLEARFGISKLPDSVRQHWIDNVTKGIVDLYRGFHDDWTQGRIPQDKVFICRFDRLVGDFEGLMGELLEFLGIEADEALEAQIHQTAEAQAARVSKHKYDLGRFGLDAETIREQCAFVYDEFLGELQ